MQVTHNIENIGIIAISVSDDRHVPKRPDLVERLANSIAEIGLINPITVTKDEHHDIYHLIAGRHRLEAVKKLKWDNIQATILEGIDALEAEQIELCENLIRNELTAAQQSIHYARLKEIAEIRYRLKSGRPADEPEGNKSQVGINLENRIHSNSSHAVAKETNRSSTAIERDARRVKNIPEIASTIGTSLDTGVELDALASLPEDMQRGLLARALAGEKVSARGELKKIEREEKERILGEKQMSFPQGRFGVVLADPAWSFQTYSEKGMDRSADNHYPCQSVEDICSWPVSGITDKNCVLFLWATVPMLPQALKVMEAWGFEYKSHVAWIKDRIGTGYWFRNQHELLLVGTKGNIPAPAPGSQFPSIISAPVADHSVKPDDFYRIIENYFPSLKKLELNARRRRDGWESYGNEVPEEEDENIPAFLKEEPTSNVWGDDDIF